MAAWQADLPATLPCLPVSRRRRRRRVLTGERENEVVSEAGKGGGVVFVFEDVFFIRSSFPLRLGAPKSGRVLGKRSEGGSPIIEGRRKTFTLNFA